MNLIIERTNTKEFLEALKALRKKATLYVSIDDQPKLWKISGLRWHKYNGLEFRVLTVWYGITAARWTMVSKS